MEQEEVEEVMCQIRDLETGVQEERERRSIRHKYRTMIDEIKKQGELINPEAEKLSERLSAANDLFKKVKKTREAALDSRLIFLCSSVGKQRAQALHTDFLTFQPLEFAEKLISHMNVNRIDSNESGESQTLSSEHWVEFGARYSHLLEKSPSFHYMYGSFETGDVEVKANRKAMRKKDKDIPTKAVVPTTVGATGNDNETTTEEVEEILKILNFLYKRNDEQPICYFEFVTDPNSFARTIENMFHVSFLVKICTHLLSKKDTDEELKDGLVSIYLDDDHLPVIEPTLQQNGETSTSKKNHQFILSITPEEWKDIVETFKIKKALIPHNRHLKSKAKK